MSFEAKIVLEAVYSNMPQEVMEEIEKIWQDYELGNDYYYFSYNVSQQEYLNEAGDVTTDYPNLSKYLEDSGIKECLIHYWW